MALLLVAVGAAVGAASAVNYLCSSGSGDSASPKHSPGQEASHAEQERLAQQAQENVERQRAKDRQEHNQPMRARDEQIQELLRLAEQKVAAEKEAALKRAKEEQRKMEEANKEWKRSMEEAIKHAREEALKKDAERRRKEKEEFPMPSFLLEAGGGNKPQWAITGDSGQGKSSLINWWAGEKVAKVGAKETTMEPVPYGVQGFDMNFWDLPGAGTQKFPKETYMRNMGLRYFDFVIIVSAGRWKEHDLELIAELKKYGVPCFMVRTKVDMDVENEEEDNEIAPVDTMKSLRKEAADNGLGATYFITTKTRELGERAGLYDNDRLAKDLVHTMLEVRHVSYPEISRSSPKDGTSFSSASVSMRFKRNFSSSRTLGSHATVPDMQQRPPLACRWNLSRNLPAFVRVMRHV